MKKDLAIGLLLYACCNIASGATSPLATTNDYYYIQPKTTNICGRVMGENGDYRLVRAEDIAFINEAWAERFELAGSSTWGPYERFPGGPLVREGGNTVINRYWSDGRISESVLETESMADRLAEASGGAMTNIVIESQIKKKLVKGEMVTKQYAELKKAKVLALEANVTYTNEDAVVIREIVEEYWQKGYGTEVTQTIWTNRVEGGRWDIKGRGKNEGRGPWIWHGDDWEVLATLKTTEKDAMSGSVKMRLAFDVRKPEEWLRGMESPKVVESVHAWGVVEVEWETFEEWWEWNVGDDQAVASNIIYRSESTNVNVLVDMGTAEWVGTNRTSLVYGVSRGMEAITSAARRVANAPSEEEVAGEAVVPELGEDGGEHERKKVLGINIDTVYLVIRLQPVASLPGW